MTRRYQADSVSTAGERILDRSTLEKTVDALLSSTARRRLVFRGNIVRALVGFGENKVATSPAGRGPRSGYKKGLQHGERSQCGFPKTKLLHLAGGALLLSACIAGPSCVLAADLSVGVQEGDTGHPIENAAVCLGTPGDPDQFGAFLTPSNGTVVYAEIPQTELVLTVSKPGFRGEQRPLPLLEHNRILTLVLSRGGFGPVCHATTPFVERRTGGLRIEDFEINAGQERTDRRQVTLNFSVEGSPTHYRASEMPDFADADWRALTPSPPFDLTSGPGEKRIYLQVRKYQKAPAGNVQMVSEPVSDTIWLAR